MAILRIAGVYSDHCHSIPIAQEIQRIAHDQRTEFHQFWTDYERLKDWVVDLIGAAMADAMPGSHFATTSTSPAVSGLHSPRAE